MTTLIFLLPLIPLQLDGKGKDSLIPDSLAQQPLRTQLSYLDSLGYSLRSSDPLKCFQAFNEGLSLAEEAGEVLLQSTFCLEISYFLFSSGNYNKSLEYSFKGYELADSAGDLDHKSWSTHRSALAFADLNDTLNALKYANLNLQLRKELGVPIRIAEGYNGLGEIYRLNGRYVEADAAYRKADSIFHELEDSLGLNMIKHNRALVATAMGKYLAAVDSLNQTWSVTHPERDFSFTLEAIIALSECYSHLGRWEEAEAQLERGFQIAADKKTLKFEELLFKQLARVKKMQGNWEKAWEAREQSLVKERELKSLAVQVESKVLGLQSENQRMTSQNLLLVEKQKNQSIVLVLLLALTILLLIIGFVVWRSNKMGRIANKRLESKNQELDLLMKVLAHDLKSPLTNISSMLLLMDQMGDQPEMRENLLDKIRKSVGRGTELIESLLELSTLESGKSPVRWEKVDLKEVCEEIESTYRERAQQKEINLVLETVSKDITTWSDNSHVRRILDNLVSNALKYSPSGTEVKMRLQTEENHFFIRVIDQGPGIRPEEKNKLFGKFEKLSARPTAGESSTGLGLAIVKVLAQQIKAEIDVNSEVGRGSTFELKIPRLTTKPELN